LPKEENFSIKSISKFAGFSDRLDLLRFGVQCVVFFAILKILSDFLANLPFFGTMVGAGFLTSIIPTMLLLFICVWRLKYRAQQIVTHEELKLLPRFDHLMHDWIFSSIRNHAIVFGASFAFVEFLSFLILPYYKFLLRDMFVQTYFILFAMFLCFSAGFKTLILLTCVTRSLFLTYVFYILFSIAVFGFIMILLLPVFDMLLGIITIRQGELLLLTVLTLAPQFLVFITANYLMMKKKKEAVVSYLMGDYGRDNFVKVL